MKKEMGSSSWLVKGCHANGRDWEGAGLDLETKNKTKICDTRVSVKAEHHRLELKDFAIKCK